MGHLRNARRGGESTRALREGTHWRHSGSKGPTRRVASVRIRLAFKHRLRWLKGCSWRSKGVEMNTLPKPRSLLLLAALAPVTLMLQSADVCAQPAKGEAPVVRRALPHDEKEKINAWTVGLAGGLLEGAPIRLAAEMARIVDDGAN